MIGCPALSPKELKLALANLKGRYALRDRALVTLGVRTGLRISELLALKVDQVWDGKTTKARFYVARQNTKGKHAGASIVLHPDAAKAVARWIKAGRLGANPGGYLFSSQKHAGRRLGRRSAWGIYEPSDTLYWQHGHSAEKSFIYVTTQHLNREQLTQLNDELGSDRSLLVCCASFRGKAEDYPNLELRKIPKAVLTKCEWGHDDYSLKIENLPQAPVRAGQQDLFGKSEPKQ